MLTAIRQWVIKTMMKGNTGVVRTLPKREIIEMNVQITAERIMRNGINPEDLKTVGQVENVVNQIEQPKVNVNPGITSVKKADVFDIDGNKIPEGSKIMGGKKVESETDILATDYDDWARELSRSTIKYATDYVKDTAGTIINKKVIDKTYYDTSTGTDLEKSYGKLGYQETENVTEYGILLHGT